jgi:hypothetical protein
MTRGGVDASPEKSFSHRDIESITGGGAKAHYEKKKKPR